MGTESECGMVLVLPWKQKVQPISEEIDVRSGSLQIAHKGHLTE